MNGRTWSLEQMKVNSIIYRHKQSLNKCWEKKQVPSSCTNMTRSDDFIHVSVHSYKPFSKSIHNKDASFNYQLISSSIHVLFM